MLRRSPAAFLNRLEADMLLQVIKGFAEVQGLSLSKDKGCYLLEKVLAERKGFSSRKKLIYRAKFRIDDEKNELQFSELLKESGLGLSSGDEGLSPGFGFKTESYKTGPGRREGSIEEQSLLFGKQYNYSFDFGVFRRSIEDAARTEGYAFIWKYFL